MKKLFALLMVCGFALAFVACGGGKAKEEAAAKAKEDSTHMADSVAKVAAEAEAATKMKADSTAKADSVAAAAAAKPAKKK